MNKLVDTHAHLYWDLYSQDYDQVLQRAKEAGVGLIINIGTDSETNKSVLQLSPKDSGIQFYSTIGIHPHEGAVLTTDQQIQEQVDQLEKLFSGNMDKIIGIGECGLDFFFRENPGFNQTELSSDQQKANQIKLYKAQIKLAKKLNLPLVIHCRDAWDDIFDQNLNGTRGVFHCFTGVEQAAKTALDLGYFISISCIITYPKNQHLRDSVKNLPLDKIITETDCPFLPPQQIRGQRNEPAYIPEIIKVISEIKNLSTDEVIGQIYLNTQSLFRI